MQIMLRDFEKSALRFLQRNAKSRGQNLGFGELSFP